MAGTLAILCESDTHERVHYAFVLAAAAAAIGRPVLLFATNGGLHGLCRDWSGLRNAERDQRAMAVGVVGLSELRGAAIALGVRLMACDAGLRIEGLDAGALLEQVEIGGATTFLSEAGLSEAGLSNGGAQIVTL